MFKKLKKQNLTILIVLSFLTVTTSFCLANFKPTYEYTTEILSQGTDQQHESFPLSNYISKFAKKTNCFLNSDYADFFNTKIVRNPEKGRKLHLDNGGIIITIKTEDGENLGCTYFNRGKEKLLVIGAGFTNDREVMTPFVAMFQDYDLILFNYRGHGYQKQSWLKPWQWTYRPTSKIFGVDNTKTKLGEIEELDVFAVVDYFRAINRYKQINGLGICYSTLIFVKAQAIRQEQKQIKLFDKLILDGCWLSLDNFAEKIFNDPKLLFNPQNGGWSEKWLVKQQWFKNFLRWLGDYLGKKEIENIEMTNYIQKIKNTPLLLWYGKDDLTITRYEFETIVKKIETTPVTAIITSNKHVINHLKQKEFYKMACELFLEQKHDVFIQSLNGNQEVS